ncbi:hypothetical protein CON64_03730 [Bacillus pseudomycoides]|nr:hypothetical protein CON64_03730 [Bacillus pseudomycoides]
MLGSRSFIKNGFCVRICLGTQRRLHVQAIVKGLIVGSGIVLGESDEIIHKAPITGFWKVKQTKMKWVQHIT